MRAFAVDKPLGWTSHDVVARARRLLGTRRVGHGGTLDPLATGVLVVLADEATKLSPFLTGSDKAYLAWVAFGVGTPTLDAEGPVSARADAGHVDRERVAAALPPFLALREQRPPDFAAVKRGGVKGYEAARRGEPLDLPPIVHVKDGDVHTEIIFTAGVDPSCAPEGYATVDLFQLTRPHESATWFPEEAAADLKAFRRSRPYLDRKRQETESMLATVRRLIPDLDARIVYLTEASPVTFHRYGWTRHGAIYGLENPAGGLPVRTPLRNMVFAGAMTQGGGVEPTALSGAFAAQALLADVLEAPARRAAAGEAIHAARS